MQYLIDFKDNTTQVEIDQYLSNNNCTVLKIWNNFDKTFLVETSAEPMLDSIVDRLVEETITAIKPHNIDLSLVAQNEIVDIDNHYNCHSNPNYPPLIINIHDEKDWWKNFSYLQPKFEGDTLELRRLGKNVDVYIMDSGIADSHPEFVDADIVKLYSVTGNDFTDRNGHGTAMAGVIVGKNCGITNATVKVVKIFDPEHNTRQSEFLSALDAIIEDHDEDTFAVINVSWSIPKNEFIEHKFRMAIAEGIYVIAAAGNDGTPIDDVTPAAMDEVITVGAYNTNLEPCDFSNYTGIIYTAQGSTNHGALDGWAPGEDIWTANIDGTCGYASGTSMAAAIATACTAANLTWKQDKNGKRLKVFQDLECSTLSQDSIFNNFLVFSRIDLIDYTDPKYSNSLNTMATLSDFCLKVLPQAKSETIVAIRVGEIKLQGIFSQTLTKEIEWLDPVPSWWTIIGNGVVIIKPTDEQAPKDGSHYSENIVRIRRKEPDGFEETITFKVWVMDRDKDIAEIPSDDPIIPYTLLVACIGLSCLSSGVAACDGYCASYSCCAGAKSSFLKCRCDPMTL